MWLCYFLVSGIYYCIYIVLQVLLHILTHTILLFPEYVVTPSQMLLQDIVQIMCRSIIVVIKYYMDCIIKYMPYVNIVNGVLTSIDQLLELMIRTSTHQIHNKLEHKYARHYEILMKEAIIMYVTTYVGSNTEY